MMVKAYGDVMDDGAVQLSFTLPLADSPRTREAAKLFVLKLGFKKCEIVHSARMSDGFTFFIAYGNTEVGVDPGEVQLDPGLAETHMNFDQVNGFISEHIGRKLFIVGACTGFDAHTVGIDAIMNMKGYNHHFGLERYPMIEAHNLGAQVPNQKLIQYAESVKADAILVSQVVTQRDAHIINLKEFIHMLDAAGLRGKFLIIAGGPRISQKLALELGFDAGFGQGAYAEHVAAFIAERIADKEEK